MKDLRFIHNIDNQKPPKYLEVEKVLEKFHYKGKKYNKKHKEKSENKSIYDDYLKKTKNSNLWKVFKNYFLEFSGNKCPICEHDISNYDDIEHFRPKNHYWWLAYNYKNYAPYCKLCNSTYKKTNFPLLNENKKVNFNTKNKINEEKPLLFNPLKDNPLDLFEIELRINLSGKGELIIKPLNTLHKNSYFYKKAKKTIGIYNLNYEQKDDITRRQRMQDRYGDLILLARFHKKFIFDPLNERTKITFFKALTDLRNKKLGVYEFIIKNKYNSDSLPE